MARGFRFLTFNILATSTSGTDWPLGSPFNPFLCLPFLFGSRRPVGSVSSKKSWTGSKLDSSNALSIEFKSRFVECYSWSYWYDFWLIVFFMKVIYFCIVYTIIVTFIIGVFIRIAITTSI